MRLKEKLQQLGILPVVTESWTGEIACVDEKGIHTVMKDSKGEEAFASFGYGAFESAGIPAEEGAMFSYKIIKQFGWYNYEFKHIPPKKRSPEESKKSYEATLKRFKDITCEDDE